MIRKLIPLIAAVALVAFFFGPGRQYLPAALRLQAGGSLVSNDGMSGMDEAQGKSSLTGLAPAAVLNPPATAARLSLAAAPAEKSGDGYLLTVQLTSPDGKPIADAPVKFFDIVDLFGSREMLLAVYPTDGRGSATYAYLPASAGTHQVVVRYAGRDGVRAGEARTTFDATVTAPAPHADARPLAPFTDRVPYAVGVLVLGVWGLIAFALIGTARGVISTARSTRGKEETA